MGVFREWLLTETDVVPGDAAAPAASPTASPAADMDVRDAFDKMRQEIRSMFNRVISAAEATWGKGAVNKPIADRTKDDVVSGLQRLIQRLQTNESMVADGATSLLREASEDFVADMKGRMNPATGRRILPLRDVLKRVEDRIMQGMQNLERTVVMKKLGTVEKGMGDLTTAVHAVKPGGGMDPDFAARLHADIQALKHAQTTGGIDPAVLDGLRQQIQGVQDLQKQSLVAQNGRGVSPDDEERIYASLQTVEKIGNLLTDNSIGLLHVMTGSTIDPLDLSAPGATAGIRKLARQDRMFQFRYTGLDGKVATSDEFDITQPSQAEEAANGVYEALDRDPNKLPSRWSDTGNKPFGSVHGTKLKPINMDATAKRAEREASTAARQAAKKAAKQSNAVPPLE